ncbi:MAG: DUF2695 domain-containing protein [Verrucomicrobiota bacterium JB025]|nr:DUF2695 domain-containing protein [Verrucomicrobiota bacterium JB025]
MASKKELRRLAIEREQQRRNQEAAEACPISRSDFEAMVDHVSDHLVDHGHEHDFAVTTAFLKDRELPVDATLSFLIERRIKDDWDVLVSGDAHGFFGPSSDRLVRMPLEEDELNDLLDWVDAEIQRSGCDHTHRLTRAWLTEHRHPPTRALGALMALGGFCDCEVAMNVETGGIYRRNNSEQGVGGQPATPPRVGD